jgi:hypothetical protein
MEQNVKCSTCRRQHPTPDYPWEKFDTPVYWSLPDDGALFKCDDCKDRGPASTMLLTQLTCGHRSVIHKECIDEYWLSVARDLGTFDK